jgi:predicted transcriptional regulator
MPYGTGVSETDGRRRAAGELEAQVMSVLWTSGRAMTPAEVQAQLDPALAYNTVQTILARLVDKRMVGRRPAGRAHAYLPLRSEAESAAAQLRATLSGAGDRERVLRRFAESLDEVEARVLRRMLAETDGAHP